MEQRLYQGSRRNGCLYLLTTACISLVTILKALKLNPLLAFIISLFWMYMALLPFSKSTISFNKESGTFIISKRLLMFSLPKKEYSFSQFYGIRNRIHWGFFMNCQTEILQRAGTHLPIRIEVFTNKISPEAIAFKSQIADLAGLEQRPDQGHA